MKAIVITLLLAGIVHADTVHLTTGKTLTGHINDYTSGTFEFENETHATQRLPAGTVLSIDFAANAGQATLDTRTKGKVTGTLVRFGDGAFQIKDAKGNIDKIPSLMVNKAELAGGGGGDEVKVITHGQRVDLADHLVAGKINIIDFYADWCGPCRMAGPQLEKMAKDDPDVVLRKIDIVNWGTPVTKQFSITSIPHIQVYDGKGKLVGDAGSDPGSARTLIAKAKADSQK